MYDHVLVPTDGSDRILEALEHASSLVQQYDAALHIIYVVQASGVVETLGDDEFEEMIQRVERAGEEAVETAVEHANDHGITGVETAIRQGVPAEEIVGYTEDSGVDMVVMATAGRTGDERDVVGSVTERVVRLSSVPVVTVNS
ncbi:universal stress protein [Halovenus salina]|uniref:Universal stress protein n=1 Tax=Halovenus salina TaxID=1510225 RepID=A0ABD5W730_9EURY|nr:universal stress protein [Halovenus salina]